MKKCCKCEEIFETPGIQCQRCRDRVTEKKPIPRLDDTVGSFGLPLALMAAVMSSKRKKR